MLLFLPTLPHLLVLWLLAHQALTSRVSCIKEYYGTPRASDCDELLGIFANANDDQPRLFDDEQLRTPGGSNFPGVKNEFPTQVVQVPAYWSLRTCNMAIMSYSESPLMHVPLGVSSWKRVHTRGDDLINRCLFMGQAEGGNVVIESYYTSNPTLSLFMWESGSYFDSVCNEIQNDPAAVAPSSALWRLASAAMGNGTAPLNATLPIPKTAAE